MKQITRCTRLFDDLALIFCGLFCGFLISFLIFFSVNYEKIRTENEKQIEIELKKRDSLCKQQLEKQRSLFVQ